MKFGPVLVTYLNLKTPPPPAQISIEVDAKIPKSVFDMFCFVIILFARKKKSFSLNFKIPFSVYMGIRVPHHMLNVGFRTVCDVLNQALRPTS